MKRTWWLTLTLIAFVAGCASEKPAEAPAKAPAPAAEAPKDAAPADAAPSDAAPSDAAPSEAAPAAAVDHAAEAKTLFTLRCVVCHGADGSGNGPGAAALKPKPRNYADAAWQAKVTDEALTKAILGGGPAVGLSPLMPPNPDLADKPEVVAELVKIVRGFAPKAAK